MRADLWQRGCERLAAELPEQQFNTWIRPLPDAEVADLGDAGATVTMRVPNRFKLDWIRTQYAGRIETAAERAGRQAGAPRLHARAARRRRQGRPAPVASAGAPVARAVRGEAGSAASHLNGAAVAGAGDGATLPSRSRLNPALTFDTLVPGPRQPDGAHRRPARRRRAGRRCTTRSSSTAASAWARRT